MTEEQRDDVHKGRVDSQRRGEGKKWAARGRIVRRDNGKKSKGKRERKEQG